MPNWCYTTVVISGSEADIDRFKQTCLYLKPRESVYKNEFNNRIDFERILPMPDAIRATEKVGFAASDVSDIVKAIDGGRDIKVGDVLYPARVIDNQHPMFMPDHRDGKPYTIPHIKVDQDTMDKVQVCLKARQDTGSLNWYDWCHTNWGTKWTPRDSTFDIESLHSRALDGECP